MESFETFPMQFAQKFLIFRLCDCRIDDYIKTNPVKVA